MTPSSYVFSSWPNHHGKCGCGWVSKRYWIRGSAELALFAHYKEVGHMPENWFGQIHTATPSKRPVRWPTAMV
jgi:hypothetical protein